MAIIVHPGQRPSASINTCVVQAASLIYSSTTSSSRRTVSISKVVITSS